MPTIVAVFVPTVCTGTTFIANPSGSIPAGTTYSWPLPAVTAGITGGATGSALTSITGLLNNSTAINQGATYTITPTAGTCIGPVFNVTVTVNPKPTVNSATLSVCSGNTISATPSGTIPAGTTYSWGLPTVTGGIKTQANLIQHLLEPLKRVPITLRNILSCLENQFCSL